MQQGHYVVVQSGSCFLAGIVTNLGTGGEATIVDHTLRRTYLVLAHEFRVLHSQPMAGHHPWHVKVDMTVKDALCPAAGYRLTVDGCVLPYMTCKTRLSDLVAIEDLDPESTGLYMVSLDETHVLVMDEENDLRSSVKTVKNVALNQALQNLVPASQYRGPILLLHTARDNSNEISRDPLNYLDFFQKVRYEIDIEGDLVPVAN
jgi:hypothetical protein